jgi:hypothetical protein
LGYYQGNDLKKPSGGRNGNTFTPEKIKIIKEILNKEELYKKENNYESNKTK